jgi:hypothetical protein
VSNVCFAGINWKPPSGIERRREIIIDTIKKLTELL